MSQKIEEIEIKKLALWTENPRDPFDSNSNNQEIADKAWEDKNEKWELTKLAKEMQTHYDFSELPTVVYHGTKPIVYDGNRRIILAKLYHNQVTLKGFDKSKLPNIPKIVPCNVCSENIAIQNVFRKHGNSGSWSPLERDIFIHRHMGGAKSNFLKMDEATNVISSNPHLNKGFVKKEIFTEDKLKEIGFAFDKNGRLQSKHTKAESLNILNNISQKVQDKVITTRKNRGKIIDVLDKNSRDLIEQNKKNSFNGIKITVPDTSSPKSKKKSPRTKKKEVEIFNGPLYLKSSNVGDLYRDIVDLCGFYFKNQNGLSQYFPSLIRMSLRLLAETAAKGINQSLDNYLKSKFKQAKKELDKDAKTTLSAQNVNETSIIQLLHIGAHNYQASNDFKQTLAVSIILGEILKIDYGR